MIMKGTTREFVVNGQSFIVYSDFIRRATIAVNDAGVAKQLSTSGYIHATKTVVSAIKRVFF